MIRPISAAVTLAAVTLALSTSHDAKADINESGVICTQSSEGFPVCTGSIGEGGASVLSYALALPGGGWTEVYDDGDWWVDHNTDGSVSIGFDEGMSGASYIHGPTLPNVPGSYQSEQKPSTAGKPTFTGPKRVLAQLKASGASKTGAFTSLTPAAAQVNIAQGQTTAPSVDVTLAGYGTCKGFLMISKDGKLVSSTLESFSFPTKKSVSLPKAAGKYKIELSGNAGCMGTKRATEVSVLYVLNRLPTRIGSR